MILLDTNAVIWLDRRHARTRALARRPGRPYLSPATLLELQFLIEAGRLELRHGATVRDLGADDRWLLDDPPSGAWFEAASDVSWTRDPFDRLIVAHAHLRGWRLATGDRALAARLGPSAALAL
jgi:PIN domain nuclease of toxin-antitoxin system